MYMAEDAGAADIIARGRLQLGISRGSPEQVIDGWQYFGYAPRDGETAADMARRQAEAFLELLNGEGFAEPRREPRVSVSRSIFALVDDRDLAYFGRDARDRDQVGNIDANTRAIFGRSYVAEPDVLVKELAGDDAIKVADTLLLTIPNQLGVDSNAHVLDSIPKHVAPELGWR